MKLSHPFASQVNFLDPLTTDDGKPYGPKRFREISKECYIISKNINTSYNDVLQITPVERKYIIDFLIEESRKTQDILDRAKAEREARKKY